MRRRLAGPDFDVRLQ